MDAWHALTSPPAWALYLFQGTIDSRWLTFVLPTLLIGIMTVAYYEGACKFTGKKPNHKPLVPLSLASLTGYSLFFIPLDNQTARILIATFFYGVCTTLTGWILCRENRHGLRIVARILIVEDDLRLSSAMRLAFTGKPRFTLAGVHASVVRFLQIPSTGHP